MVIDCPTLVRVMNDALPRGQSENTPEYNKLTMHTFTKLQFRKHCPFVLLGNGTKPESLEETSPQRHQSELSIKTSDPKSEDHTALSLPTIHYFYFIMWSSRWWLMNCLFGQECGDVCDPSPRTGITFCKGVFTHLKLSFPY